MVFGLGGCAATFAACNNGGMNPRSPFAATTLPSSTRSWMNAAAKKTGLLYVSMRDDGLGPDSGNNDVGFGGYPAGGTATKILNRTDIPVGSVVSAAR